MNFRQSPPSAVGQAGEALAERFLEAEGLELIERNYRCASGEIDLVMRHGDTLVFVEVRSRKSAAFGSALETVSASKQRKLIAAARHYVAYHRLSSRQALRFDVVGVTGGEVQWVENAFYGV